MEEQKTSIKTCKNCSAQFEIFERDLEIYERFQSPVPSLCPDCRMQRRTAFRNECNFHKTKCALTGKNILTNILPSRGYKILSFEAWYGDKWDPCEYGREFDFNRPFFEQMAELCKDVPHINLMNDNCENCDYCNHSVHCKDCFLCMRAIHAEKCYYSYQPLHSFHCFDCYYIHKTQESYESSDCTECYNMKFCRTCSTCSDLIFCDDCIGCQDCYGCTGLNHKQYYFFNKPLKKEEYFKVIAELDLGSYGSLKKAIAQAHEEILKHPIRTTVNINTENVIGNYIYRSRNIYHGFDVNDCEDVRYSWGNQFSKDAYDTYTSASSHDTYNTVAPSDSQMIKYSYLTYGGCYDLEYCMECSNNTKDCFGCIGLKHKQYCILNKQYTKEEYQELKEKIIEHMRTPVSAGGGRAPASAGGGKSTEEYGEYFPMALSLFPYNESVAHEYFPLDKKEAEAKELFWFEEEQEKNLSKYQIPDHIRDVKDDILDTVLACEITGTPYKIIPQELEFYRKNNLPIPRICPHERHIRRLRSRGPRKLWERTCGKCGAKIKSAYSPDRPEIVYCEACYLKSVL